MPLLGAHMSIEGGLHKAFERISTVRGESLQIFSKNQRQWKSPALEDDEITLFRKAWKQWGKGPVAVHDSYLINLANPDTTKANRAVAAFADEISRAGLLSIPYLIMHPGSHVGAGLEKGLAQLTTNLDRAFKLAAEASSVMVLLPTRARNGFGDRKGCPGSCGTGIRGHPLLCQRCLWAGADGHWPACGGQAIHTGERRLGRQR